MAKIISSLPGSTGVLSKTSQLINDGETGISTYVELNDLSTVATTGDYNNLINIPIDFTPKVHTHNISDISGTKSEFNTSLIDGNFLFVGDVLDTPDATIITKGKLKLSGDLSGTADLPTVPELLNKVDKVAGKSLIADAEIARLATLYNYTHPANHPPSIITQDASNRFVTDVEKTAWNAKQGALGFTPENVANKNTANGYAGLGADGKLISSQLPDITISDTFVTASQAAMLALTAETGDVAVRTDLNKSFILKINDPTVLANWQELLTPTSAVTTVFGRNGGVTAQTGDYNADQITETATRKFQTSNQNTFNDATSSIQTQLNGKQPTITAGTTSQYYRGDKTFQPLNSTAVGLGNVNNTSDVNKPVSTATQTELNLKANLASPALTGTPTAPTATAGTNTTQVATTAFVLANTRPYKVYTALLSQSGTSAPVATVLENTLGGTVVWSRSNVGTYVATLNGAFILNKTCGFFSSNNGGNPYVSYVNISSLNSVSIQTVNSTNGTSFEAGFTNASVEIRVYL